MSWSSLAFSVAFMSISVSTPKPWSDNASRVRATASANEDCSDVEMAMLMRVPPDARFT